MPKVPDDLTRAVVCPFRHLLSPRRRVFSPVGSVSMTKQSFRDECDINVIMARYQATGVLPVVQVKEGRFLDVPVDDYQTAMFKVAEAKSMFAGLPAKVRDRFGNDPGKLLEFLQDDRNVAEARELGLVKPEVDIPAPIRVSVVSDGASGVVPPPGGAAVQQNGLSVASGQVSAQRST